MKRISEIEYIELIEKLDSEKSTFQFGVVDRLKDKMRHVLKHSNIPLSFKREFDNTLLLNFGTRSIEIDKFQSLYCVSVISGKNREDLFYTFKNINMILENLQNLTYE